MSDESNALMALKNAWSGAVATSEAVDRFGRTVVNELPADAPVSAWRLDEIHELVLAQANAVMALRGLVEELRRTHGLVASGSGS